MNKWKVAFIIFFGGLVVAIGILGYYITKPAPNVDIPAAATTPENGTVLNVSITKAELEEMAKSYLQDKMEKSALPVELSVQDDIQINSEIAVFTARIPITMHFEPVVKEDGNILLEQTKMNVGSLKIPTETTLKLLRKSVHLPSWIEIIPNDAQIFVDLSRVKLPRDSQAKAKEFDLKNDRILLEVTVPKK